MEFSHQSQHRYRWLIVAVACILLIIATAFVASWRASRYDMPSRNAPSASGLTIDTDSSYYQQLKNAAKNDVSYANRISQLTNTPLATWLTGTNDKDEIMRVHEQASATNTTPLYVLYNIPDRDSSGRHSSGGAMTADAYAAWIDDVTSLIDDHPSIVIIEPDALADTPSLSSDQQTSRIQSLAYAIEKIGKLHQTAVYLDAGNSNWRSAQETADLLARIQRTAEDTRISGISLNVSQFISTEDTMRYAASIQQLYGEKLYIIVDTSRNSGTVTKGEWCNPSGQKIGTANTLFDPSDPLLTAFIKRPGESDGVCGISQKPAGQFDIELLKKQL